MPLGPAKDSTQRLVRDPSLPYVAIPPQQEDTDGYRDFPAIRIIVWKCLT
jgi:hypothetical protein